MKVSETPSLTEFGFFPGSLPLDPSDARARRKFIKGFTAWVFPSYRFSDKWDRTVEFATAQVCKKLAARKRKGEKMAWFDFLVDAQIFRHPWTPLKAQGKEVAEWPYTDMTYTEVTAGCTVQSAVYAEYLTKEQSKGLAATNKLGAKNRSQSQGTVPVMQGRPVLDQLGVEATTKPSSTTNTIPNPFASQRKRPASAIETPLASNSSVVSMSETTSPAPPSVIHRDKRPRSDFHVLDLDGSHDAIAAPSHRAGASRPLSPISKELISPKSLSEPLPDMETDLENRGVVWNKFFGPDSIRNPITGPFQLQMSLCIPMQHLSSGERVASLNQTLHSVQITYSPQTRELVLGFVPKSGPSEWSSRTEILTIWTDVKEWATAVHEGVPAYLDSFVTRAISDRCHVDTSDGDPMMKAYQSILNSRFTPKKCLETIELRQSNKIVFQELLTGSFDDIRRKLGSWVFEFTGSKFTAVDIATEEWLDYCEVQHRQAVREWSKTAKEFVRCMDENKA